ncbi:MAG: hypothetical protein AAGB26_11740 [Planctomycetota bacterium]
MTSESSLNKARWKKWPIGLFVALIITLVSGELFARYYLGLGDPPLFMADSEIEYLYQPSQSVMRFGNRIQYNAFSMRSDPFPKQKPDHEFLRVLVLGDSVINGGSLTDQDELATEILKARLSQELDGIVQVGNISTGSWGPANLLAYIEKYGLFDADAVVLVISSQDATDVPTFTPRVGVSSSFPDQTPFFALQEAISRYLPRYLPSGGGHEKDQGKKPSHDEEDEFPAISDLEALIKLVKDSQTPFVILLHPTRDEVQMGYGPAYDAIVDAADRLDIDRLDFAPYLERYIQQGRTVYRDQIHPNASGQEALAEALYASLEEAGVLVKEAE